MGDRLLGQLDLIKIESWARNDKFLTHDLAN